MQLAAWLSLNPLFADLEPRALKELARRAEWVELPSGQVLFRPGDAADAFYVVVHGRLRTAEPTSEDSSDLKVTGEIGRAESVGELAVIIGEPRVGMAYAVRDSGLIRISALLFERLLEKYPASMMRVARLIVARMVHAHRSAGEAARVNTRTIAVVSAQSRLDISGLCAGLATELGVAGPAMRLDVRRVDAILGVGFADTPFSAQTRNRHLLAWLNGLEGRYRYLVYQGSGASDPWTTRCLRQADRILVAVDVEAEPGATPMLELLRDSGVRAPVELVFMGRKRALHRPDIYGWRALAGAEGHHHLIPGETDLSHLARLATGRALGLIFAGGGARGFAHLGLLRALQERQMPIDMIGGTSMGAFLGALCAKGLSLPEMTEVVRATFVDNNYLNDYTIPRVSLISARKFLQRLSEVFGDTAIEDLPIPYFSVSTNITRGCVAIHDRGPLASYVGASMAVPGIAPPMVDRGELLVDGGLINNLPTDVMHAMGRGKVIASDVSGDDDLRVDGLGAETPEPLKNARGEGPVPNIFRILFRTATLTSDKEMDAQQRVSDLYLRMPVGNFGMFDWEAIDAIVDKGYEYASAALDEARRTGVL